MSWQATIIGTERERDLLKIIVKYFDETHEFTDTIGSENINETIESKVKDLNNLDTLEQSIISIGLINKSYEIQDNKLTEVAKVEPILEEPIV